jgi:hypothetical protein
MINDLTKEFKVNSIKVFMGRYRVRGIQTEDLRSIRENQKLAGWVELPGIVKVNQRKTGPYGGTESLTLDGMERE